MLKAYRALCDPCTLKKIEIRVPREEALKLGLIRKPVEETPVDESNEEGPSAGMIEESVAEQVIPEEQNEDEEEKKEAETVVASEEEVKTGTDAGNEEANDGDNGSNDG